MSSIASVAEDPLGAALDALDAAFDAVLAIDVTTMTTREQLRMLRRVEIVGRRLPAIGHQVIAALQRNATPAELGDTLSRALADTLRISPTVAGRRVADAENLGPRQALSGEPLQPWLPTTATLQRDGHIGEGHVRVIRELFKRLPGHIDAVTRATTERELATLARGLRPDQLKAAAARMEMLLNPDGNFSEEDRARRRGVTLGRQGVDGMSAISGLLDPELRATLEAIFAKWAAPGMCNPADESPCVDGEASHEVAARDGRSPRQRNHDALKAAGRAVLASGQLGIHNGLPVTVIISTTLAELESAAGVATTGGSTWLPMSDAWRMATHSHHYLAIFDGKGSTLDLYRTKRIASPEQRIVLHAKDRGCTHPGCTVPGYGCQAHHAVLDWSAGGVTNVDDLTFACGVHNRLVKDGGWQTRKRADGTTEWIPPAHLDVGQSRINGYHHPQRYLTRDQTDTDP